MFVFASFSISPGTPNAYGLIGTQVNAIAPGKRMLSSMSPTFIDTDRRMAVLGTPGGSRIITMVLNAILAFHEGQSARDIVSMPRFHPQFLPDHIQYEPSALSESMQGQLQAMGHELRPLARRYGNMQAVVHDYARSRTTAASDPRGIGNASVE